MIPLAQIFIYFNIQGDPRTTTPPPHTEAPTPRVLVGPVSALVAFRIAEDVSQDTLAFTGRHALTPTL